MGLNTGLIPSREQLLERLCGGFAHVRQKVLLTDDTHKTTAFTAPVAGLKWGTQAVSPLSNKTDPQKGSQISCAPMRDY